MTETVCCGANFAVFNTSTGRRARCEVCTVVVDEDTGMPVGAVVDGDVLDMTEAIW